MKEWSVNILIQASTLLEIWQDYREETEKEERGSFFFFVFQLLLFNYRVLVTHNCCKNLFVACYIQNQDSYRYSLILGLNIWQFHKNDDQQQSTFRTSLKGARGKVPLELILIFFNLEAQYAHLYLQCNVTLFISNHQCRSVLTSYQMFIMLRAFLKCTFDYTIMVAQTYSNYHVPFMF